ncbi:DUF2973 domain-containing protein [Pantanalinema rosaneae CENA516]|uniref:DUF2973 domain-containing protein n=1 Tax=Pantanalinema rosaneae TaxID=1620701 RepID=UPI003D6F1F98
MILHLLYILAFTILAFLAVANLIRNLMTLGMESQRSFSSAKNRTNGSRSFSGGQPAVPHPEFLDNSGNVINEPLLVMRSMTVDDAREQLDALYESSPGSSAPGSNNESRDDS